ncbi:unnamed protein product [Adineta steineri]|uniref:Polymerase nucleotidyl transferase domain-containing protein n=1 Tax=Adineta steineri TaxID=433720 RepID=A0A815JVQ3_9BILA|nr:unnamed protein product [Adineta steineri]CAF1384535.1 unnamed protein product [Adineta steineri]
MDHSAISSILQELNLNEQDVANIYHHGSWVYGTNLPTSDRDLIIVTHTHQDPLKFHCDLDYFHAFELYKLWNQYDICVYSKENFEKTLEKNYLCSIQFAFYENFTARRMYNLEDDSIYPQRSSTMDETSQSSRDYLFKNLFHGFRYLDFAEQLIQTKSIHDFKRVSYILDEMKTIRGDPTDDSNRDNVLDFIAKKSTEYKSKLDLLVPTNAVKGTFEAHATFDCTHNTEEVIEKLKKVCENTKYKIIFIDLETNQKNYKLQQLMTSSYHCGEYPSIVKQIEEEVYKYFQDFNIIRLKIESLASNEGVPKTDIEKKLYWDHETNYFEFHYKVLIQNDKKKEKYEKLKNICTNLRAYNLHLSRNAFKELDNDDYHYMITMRLFDNGQESAFKTNDVVVNDLTTYKFPPLKVVREFIVYDNHIDLDQGWN